jgi:hypothetical protein
VSYAETGLVANQITTLEKLDRLTFDPEFDRKKKLAPGFPPRPDTVAGRTYSSEQARAYLDVNCSYCHNNTPDATNSAWFAGFDGPFSEMLVCAPGVGAGTKIVVPHSPYVEGQQQSKMMARMEAVTPRTRMMPPLAKTVKDAAGLNLIGRWISELASTCASPTVGLMSIGASTSTDTCLTVASQTPGAVAVSSCASTDARQSFTIDDDGGGYVSLRSSAGNCVQETATAGEVRTGPCVSQAWRRVSLPGGAFELRSKKSGLCLHAATGPMRAVACTSQATQFWTTVAR